MSISPFGIKHRGGDCYATWYAQKKAAELAGKYGFAADEDEDLAQDLALHLLRQWPQYDPSKGKPTTFIQNVIDTKVCQLIRDQCDPKRDFRRLRSLSDVSDAAEYGLLDGVRGQPEVRIIGRDDAEQLGAGDEILHDDDADIVFVIVDEKLWSTHGFLHFAPAGARLRQGMRRTGLGSTGPASGAADRGSGAGRDRSGRARRRSRAPAPRPRR